MTRLRNSCHVRCRSRHARTCGCDRATISGRWNIMSRVLEREGVRTCVIGLVAVSIDAAVALDGERSNGCFMNIVGTGDTGSTSAVIVGGSTRSSLGAESSVSVSEGVRVKWATSRILSNRVAILRGGSGRLWNEPSTQDINCISAIKLPLARHLDQTTFPASWHPHLPPASTGSLLDSIRCCQSNGPCRLCYA